MKFNYLLFIIFSFYVSGCEKEIECIIIQDKYGGNGAFYFQWDRTTRGNTEMQIGTGSVSENIFNQYDIGDIYCIEELML
jgi:hypothetical protein